MANWSFLTKHGRALLCIARDPGVRLRDIAAALEITERSAYAIVGDLADGRLRRSRSARAAATATSSSGTSPLPETTMHDRTIGDVLDVVPRDEVRGAPDAEARAAS